MKLSRNLFVGSVATAGILLGVLAPTTAQAATSTGKVNESTGAVENSIGNEQTVNIKNGELAIAYDAGDGKTVGDATATSNANVKVVSGILTLDAVPNFGFGSAVAGTTVDMINNDGDSSVTDDGNTDGLLQVTESRTNSDGTTPGFTLTAGLGQFSNNGTPYTADKDAGDTSDFQLLLNPMTLKDSTGADINGADGTAQTTKQANPIAAATPTAATVMDLKGGSYKDGQIKAEFTKDNKGAQLFVPQNVSKDAGRKAQVKSYTGAITWTLTPTAQDTLGA